MTRRVLPLCAWVAIAWAPGAIASETPPGASMYDEDDEGLEDKLLIEQALGLFLVKPPRRHPAEVVELYRDRATIRYWYSLGPDPEQLACEGLRWMVFGRNQWAGGLQRIFDETEIREVNLHFGHLPKGRDGKPASAKSFRRYLEMRVTRRKAANMPIADARHVVDTGEGCGEFMRKHFDRYRFDNRYYARELKRHSKGR